MYRLMQSPSMLLLVAIVILFLISRCAGEAPLVTVPLPQSLPQSMKGYELYSWRSGGAWRFTIITGTNRSKTLAEITSTGSLLEGDWVKITVEGLPDLQSVLELLPKGTEIFWLTGEHPVVDDSTSQVSLKIPPESLVKKVQAHCAEYGIQVEISP